MGKKISEKIAYLKTINTFAERKKVRLFFPHTFPLSANGGRNGE
jgi:hypothetical protein